MRIRKFSSRLNLRRHRRQILNRQTRRNLHRRTTTKRRTNRTHSTQSHTSLSTLQRRRTTIRLLNQHLQMTLTRHHRATLYHHTISTHSPTPRILQNLNRPSHQVRRTITSIIVHQSAKQPRYQPDHTTQRIQIPKPTINARQTGLTHQPRPQP